MSEAKPRISQQLTPPAVPSRHGLWQMVLSILAVLAVVFAGVLLARVLWSPAWTKAVSAVGLGALAVILLVSPRAGLLLWLLLAPFSGYIYLSIDLGRGLPGLDLTRLSALLLLLLLIARLVQRTDKQLVRPTWMDIALAAFVGAMLLSVPASHFGLVSGAQAILTIVLIPLLAYYFARRWLRSKRDLLALVAVVAILGVLLALITVREQLTGQAIFSPLSYGLGYETRILKVLSLFGTPTIMALTLVVALPLLVYGIHQAATLNSRLLLGSALVIVLAGVFFTYVRAGWLGALVGLLIVMALSPGVRRALLPMLPLIAVAVLLLVTFAVVNPETVQGRLTSEAPITYRLTAWRISWDIFLRSPLFGIGYDNFGETAATEFGWNPHKLTLLTGLPSPHNSYLYVLVSGGLLALIPFLAIFVILALRGLAYWRTLPSHRDLVAVLWATLLSYLVMNGTFDALNAQFPNLLFFVIVGAILGYLEREQEAALQISEARETEPAPSIGPAREGTLP